MQVVALFPFFQVDLSSGQQQMLYRLTCVPRVMGVLGGLLGLLPLAVQQWLVNWWGGMLFARSHASSAASWLQDIMAHTGAVTSGGLENYATEATVGLLNYHTIRNGFHLGHAEFKDLAAAVDWRQLQDLGKGVSMRAGRVT